MIFMYLYMLSFSHLLLDPIPMDLQSRRFQCKLVVLVHTFFLKKDAMKRLSY